MKNKTNISVQDNRGIRVTSSMIIGPGGKGYSSGDILDANATVQLINDKLKSFSDIDTEVIDQLQDVSSLLENKVDSTDLAAVATSGSYDDLDNKPQIPVIPINVSSFTNDSGYLTNNDISSLRSSVLNIQELIEADETAVDTAIDKFEEIVDFLDGIEPGSELYNIINSHIDNGNSQVVKHVEVLTLAQFDALQTKDANTEYNII